MYGTLVVNVCDSLLCGLTCMTGADQYWHSLIIR